MDKYINREALINAFQDDEYQVLGEFFPLDEAIAVINEQPAADVVEVRHGEWQVEVYGQRKNYRDVICPICCVNYACHTGMLQLQRFSYCPNCGAKMDGVPDTNVGKMDGKGEGE